MFSIPSYSSYYGSANSTITTNTTYQDSSMSEPVSHTWSWSSQPSKSQLQNQTQPFSQTFYGSDTSQLLLGALMQLLETLLTQLKTMDGGSENTHEASRSSCGCEPTNPSPEKLLAEQLMMSEMIKSDMIMTNLLSNSLTSE